MRPSGATGNSDFGESHGPEQGRFVQGKRDLRLQNLASALNEAFDIRKILLEVRNCAIEEFGFDRAAVFFYDAPHNLMRGSWGTDSLGNLEDMESVSFLANQENTRWRAVEERFVLIQDCQDASWAVGPMTGVRSHAVIHLQSDGESVGFIGVDNLLSGRSISEIDVCELLPLAELAAAAIRKAMLLSEREQNIKRQRRLMEISTSLNASTDLSDVLRLVRNTVIEECRFDRAAVFLYDEASGLMRGTWGTDRDGREEDIHDQFLEPDGMNRELWGLGDTVNEKGYTIIRDFSARGWAGDSPTMEGVEDHAVIQLRVSGKIVGYIPVDNLLSQRTIAAEDVERMLPFAHEAAAAIHKARLLEEREKIVKRQRRLIELSNALNARLDLSSMLRMVRDIVVEECGFDRAGVFLYDPVNCVMVGTWGTDRFGEAEDTNGVVLPHTDENERLWGLRDGPEHRGYIITEASDSRKWGIFDSSMDEVGSHAIVHLRANGEIVGYIGIDNLISMTPITSTDVEQMLPFAHQAAMAIQRATLLDERERVVNRQKRLMELSIAFNASVDLSTILRLVRDTVVEECGFDRAGVFLYDKPNQVMRGAWGTDKFGNVQDIHHVVLEPMNPGENLWGMNQNQASKGYVKIDNCASKNWKHSDQSMRQVRQHVIVHLRANGEVVGFIGVDNLLTDRDIKEEEIDRLLPFAHQAAAAIHKARILEEREQIVKHQRRLMEMSVAIGSNQDLDKIFELVRDAVLETKIVDRVAFWLANGETAYGTYGTSLTGEPTDEHDKTFSFGANLSEILNATDCIKIEPLPAKMWFDGRHRDEVPHATIIVKTGSKLVGFLTVDNILTRRAITREDLEMLLPFTEQAATAIAKAGLVKEQEEALRRQRRLMQMAAAIGEQQNLDAIFRMVCEAIVETGWVDRVSVWLAEGDSLRGSMTLESSGEFSLAAHVVVPILACSVATRTICEDGQPYAFGSCLSNEDDRVEAGLPYPHAAMALRSGSELQGVISIDTIRTGRPITAADLELVLPFAEQVAVAIVNAKLVQGIQAELERRRLAEKELREQAAELVKARDEALEATHVKSQFLANMSHEIRTPLNGVIGMTSLVMETELQPTQMEYLQTVKNSADSLLALINDILDFSKIEAGKMLVEQAPFNLRLGMEEVAELMSSRLGSKPLVINVSLPPDFPDIVVGDCGRIRQILTNLAGNAVKFTERGEVVIRATLEDPYESRGTLRIEVLDTGIGIAPDRQGQIFESFTQADGSMSRRYGGTGLGLTLTKQLVELMGGRIGLESTEGSGSIFWAEVPIGVVQSTLSDRCPCAVGKSVLVIDPCATTRNVAASLLSFWECTVLDFESVETAMSVLTGGAASQPLDLIMVNSRSLSDDELDSLGKMAAATTARIALLVPLGDHAPNFVGPTGQTLAILRKPIRKIALKSVLERHFGSSSDVFVTTAPDSRRSSLGLRILVAEDNVVNTKLISRYLGALGCDAICVVNGRDAVRELEQSEFDVVLMDLQMPVMDGFEATKLIRESCNPAKREIPIIALTAHAQHGDREKCLEAGMNDYLSKPIDRKDLEAKLSWWGEETNQRSALKPAA